MLLLSLQLLSAVAGSCGLAADHCGYGGRRQLVCVVPLISPLPLLLLLFLNVVIGSLIVVVRNVNCQVVVDDYLRDLYRGVVGGVVLGRVGVSGIVNASL